LTASKVEWQIQPKAQRGERGLAVIFNFGGSQSLLATWMPLIVAAVAFVSVLLTIRTTNLREFKKWRRETVTRFASEAIAESRRIEDALARVARLASSMHDMPPIQANAGKHYEASELLLNTVPMDTDTLRQIGGNLRIVGATEVATACETLWRVVAPAFARWADLKDALEKYRKQVKSVSQIDFGIDQDKRAAAEATNWSLEKALCVRQPRAFRDAASKSLSELPNAIRAFTDKSEASVTKTGRWFGT
jgi:hypothetical protein